MVVDRLLCGECEDMARKVSVLYYFISLGRELVVGFSFSFFDGNAIDTMRATSCVGCASGINAITIPFGYGISQPVISPSNGRSISTSGICCIYRGREARNSFSVP